jgi:hypothetical protein
VNELNPPSAQAGGGFSDSGADIGDIEPQETPMRRNGWLAVVASGMSAGALYAQSPSATVTVHWKNTGSSAAAPTQWYPSPGESVDIWVNVSFSGPGSIVGLVNIVFDLQAGPNVGGSWTLSGPGFNGSDLGPGWNLNRNNYGRRLDLIGGWALSTVGTPQGNGSIRDAYAGQFPTSILEVNPSNPVIEIWRARWTPDSYEPRNLTWQAQKAAAAITGVALWLDDGGPLPTAVHIESAAITWGSIIIPIPAPSALALLGAAAVIAGRHRR